MKISGYEDCFKHSIIENIILDEAHDFCQSRELQASRPEAAMGPERTR